MLFCFKSESSIIKSKKMEENKMQYKIFGCILAASVSIDLYKSYQNEITFCIMLVATGFSTYLCIKDMTKGVFKTNPQ